MVGSGSHLSPIISCSNFQKNKTCATLTEIHQTNFWVCVFATDTKIGTKLAIQPSPGSPWLFWCRSLRWLCLQITWGKHPRGSTPTPNRAFGRWNQRVNDPALWMMELWQKIDISLKETQFRSERLPLGPKICRGQVARIWELSFGW